MGKKATLYLLHWIMIVIAIVMAISTYQILYNSGYRQNTYFSIPTMILPVILIFNIALTIYWGVKLKFAFIIPLITLCMSYPYISAKFRFGKKGDEITMRGKIDDNNLKIATFNTFWFGGNKYEANLKGSTYFFYAQNVDIVCYQEYVTSLSFGEKDLKHLFSKYPFSCSNKYDNEREDVAIFSRYPIISWERILYPQSKYSYIKADILLEDIDKYISMADSLQLNRDSIIRVTVDSLVKVYKHDKNKIIRVYNTHLETTGLNETKSSIAASQKSGISVNKLDALKKIIYDINRNSNKRSEQVDILYRDMAESPYPVILCGDFNDTPSSYAYYKISKLLDDGYKECGKGFAYSYNRLCKLFRIDYIFHDKRFRSVKYYSFDKEWSDHNPVISEIDLQPTADTNSSIFRFWER